jgi:hypothetical protein
MNQEDFEDRQPDRSGRDGKGRFQKGVSGNLRGRKMQFPRDPRLPASCRCAIMDVADTLMEVKVDGQPRRMSLFEANVHALAVAGAKGNRVASQKFIELMLRLSEIDLERRLVTQRMREHFDAVEEENENFRKANGNDGPVVLGPE